MPHAFELLRNYKQGYPYRQINNKTSPKIKGMIPCPYNENLGLDFGKP
jgi:hypothetical protein